MLDVALVMPCGPEDWRTRMTEATGCHRIIPISISPIDQVPIASVGSDPDEQAGGRRCCGNVQVGEKAVGATNA